MNIDEFESLEQHPEIQMNGRLIDWDLWMREPELSRDQATRLLSGLDPEVFIDLDRDCTACDTGLQRAKAKQFLETAEGQKVESLTFREWFDWAQENFPPALSEIQIYPGFVSAITRLQQERNLELKKRYGRYTITEAGKLIAEHSGGRWVWIAGKLMDSACEDGGILAYEPGSTSSCEPAFPERTDNYEVYWDDVNSWLDSKEPRIVWRFPPPALDETKPELDDINKKGVEQEIRSRIGKDAVAHRSDQKLKPGWIRHCREALERGYEIKNLSDLENIDGYDPQVLNVKAPTRRSWAKEAGVKFAAGRPKEKS